MNLQVNLKIFILFVCFVAILMVYYTQYNNVPPPRVQKKMYVPKALPKTTKDIITKPRYAISNSRCKMLEPNPWDSSVLKYLHKPQSLVCSHLPQLAYIDHLDNSSSVLRIHKKHFKKYKVRPNQSVQCCYSVITRVEQDSENYNSTADNQIHLSKCVNFTDQVLLPNETEFMLVKCLSYQDGNKKGKEIYKNVHATVPILPSARLKMDTAGENETYDYGDTVNSQKPDTKRLNIIIVGIDSISKLNIQRVMPKTLNYFQENNWIDLNGYNKVGENTFPNLMAILNGQPIDKLRKWWSNSSLKMDECPAIWKEYNAAGYITLYAEDTPTISTFNFMKTGFVERPTDYYMRPFMLAAHQLLRQKKLNGLTVCTGPGLVLDYIFDYAKTFYKKFSNYNHFSLLWSNSLSHNDINAPKALDNSVYQFLTDLTKLGVYENSIILILSDHGIRFGNIRETFIGYLEERLPFMFMWFPQSFREMYPDKYKNLMLNQYRLTSPYDIHVTLKVLLEMDANRTVESERFLFTNNDIPWPRPIAPACPKCNGLLEVQSANRTCEDASIDVNWCLCSEFKSVNPQDKTALAVGIYIYEYIVNRTDQLLKRENIKKTLCAKWKFSKVYRTHEVIEQQGEKQNLSGDIDSNNIIELNSDTQKRIFVVIVELNPGHTKFESTIKMSLNDSSEAPKFEFLEHPKRLDGVFKTSKCVNVAALKQYCYCVKKK